MIRRLLYLSLSIALAIGIVSPFAAKADTKLDEIEEYKITVDMESDGSMDMTYHIDWKVLNDTSEGPLTWVKVGIPNQYVDNIKALSPNISDIYYYGEGGDYVCIDFNRSYNAGEIATMDFSFRQSKVCILDSDLCYFCFTPGWFDKIDIKEMTILWNSKNALYSDAPNKDGDYYMWTKSLAAGEELTVTVVYSKDTFDGVPSSTDIINSSSSSGNSSYIIYTIIGVILLALRLAIRFMSGGGYRGGFGGHGGHFGGGGHCACAGCACACACAGGGRAGCSAKNFYSPETQTSKLKYILKENRKYGNARKYGRIRKMERGI